jgi:RNA polymerase sigma-70 factor (ECF subfamily)
MPDLAVLDARHAPPDPRHAVETIDLAEARDRDLVARIGRGDAEAFRSLFAAYAPVAGALALRVVRQAHLAEEIVQEAFLSVWRNPGGYDPARGSVRAWLMGTIHHRAVDLVRREEAHRRRAEAAIPSAAEELQDHADEVAGALDRPAERLAVRAALREIPPEQGDVIRLMYFEGLTQSQIAEATGLPLGTVKSRALLGMRRLRTTLGRLAR